MLGFIFYWNTPQLAIIVSSSFLQIISNERNCFAACYPRITLLLIEYNYHILSKPLCPFLSSPFSCFTPESCFLFLASVWQQFTFCWQEHVVMFCFVCCCGTGGHLGRSDLIQLYYHLGSSVLHVVYDVYTICIPITLIVEGERKPACIVSA